MDPLFNDGVPNIHVGRNQCNGSTRGDTQMVVIYSLSKRGIWGGGRNLNGYEK